MKQEQILVLGATGKTGRRVADRLTSMGKNVRLGSRSASPAFDWHDPQGWADVLKGISKVYITFQPDLAVPAALEAITAFTKEAVAAGVQQLVILSGRGEAEAQRCEEIVMSSGIDWTVVRCDWFSQNFSESFFIEPILSGHLAVPRTETRVPYVDVDDIADVVVAALTEAGHTGKVHELTGPDLLTFHDVVNEISRATGREIQLHPISLEEYAAMLEEHGVPEDYRWLINYLFTYVLDGRNSGTTKGVEQVLGRKAKSFAQYAVETAATGVWTN
ncbi:MAG: NAD(P)H-binding protein [Roseivirga sp.]|nr:NAD(P)H-binding protein [Roseivirga sp.]